MSKPIVLKQVGSKWEVFLDTGAARRFGARKAGMKGLPLDARVPLVRREIDRSLEFRQGGTPERFSKSDAEGLAHQIGRYKLGFGDLVYTYVQEERGSSGDRHRTRAPVRPRRGARTRSSRDPKRGAFPFADTRIARSFHDYLDRLESAHPSYVYGTTAGRDYLRVWRHPQGSSSKSIVVFVDHYGNAYKADSWKKRGRLLGQVSGMGAGVPERPRPRPAPEQLSLFGATIAGRSRPRRNLIEGYLRHFYDARAARPGSPAYKRKMKAANAYWKRMTPGEHEQTARYMRGETNVMGDRGRGRHRAAGAPTFAQQKEIGRKIRLLRREGRPERQAVAMAYRYAGVPPRTSRGSRDPDHHERARAADRAHSALPSAAKEYLSTQHELGPDSFHARREWAALSASQKAAVRRFLEKHA
jgi:hypothetical protein